MKIDYPAFSVLQNRVICSGICFDNFRKAFFFYYFKKFFAIAFFHKQINIVVAPCFLT